MPPEPFGKVSSSLNVHQKKPAEFLSQKFCSQKIVRLIASDQSIDWLIVTVSRFFTEFQGFFYTLQYSTQDIYSLAASSSTFASLSALFYLLFSVSPRTLLFWGICSQLQVGNVVPRQFSLHVHTVYRSATITKRNFFESVLFVRNFRLNFFSSYFSLLFTFFRSVEQ